MKTLATLSLVSIFTSSMAFAGSLGGPGPFRNDSPLPTGTDGTYNASLRGPNTSGIFRFSISNGTQSGDVVPSNPSVVNPGIYSSRSNAWVAWYEGIVYRGLTDAAIIEGKVAGVLDPMVPPNSQVNPPTMPSLGTTTTTTGPIVTTFPSNPFPQPNLPSSQPVTPSFTSTTTSARTTTAQQVPPVPAANALTGGQFSGSLSLNSPTGSMSGKGSFVVIEDLGPLNASGQPRAASDPQFVSKEVEFRWRGARVNTGSSSN